MNTYIYDTNLKRPNAIVTMAINGENAKDTNSVYDAIDCPE